MSTHKPTAEQSAVIDAFGTGSTLVVEAGAGCGKSSTLKMLATTTKRRGIYVAYNRSLADEAKRDFPSSVRCSTAHGLAYGPVGSRFRHRLNGPRLPAREVAKILRINSPVRVAEDKAPLAPNQLARIVNETVEHFCNSADAEVGRQHLYRIEGLTLPEMDELAKAIVPWAQAAWDDLTGYDGRLKFGHNCYLKMFQLTDPHLSCDFLLLDEAQDSSPVMSAIFDRQTHAQRIMVGDASQAIYGFRGAVDAMSKFAADERLTLSQSFRFGPAVAHEANKWLDLLDAPIRLRGFEKIASRIGSLTTPDAVLCRSNAECVARLMSAAQAGRTAALVGGGNDIRRLAEAAITLKQGRGTDHPELFMFRTWGELQQYVEEDSAGSDLRVFVKLIDSHGPEVVIDTIDRLVSEDLADVVISTAHKAKGREWDTVTIASDFHEPKRDDDGQVGIPRQDAMLAYVAVTRAKIQLDREGLAWVDRYVTGPRWNADLFDDEPDIDVVAPEAPPAPVEVAVSTSTHCRRCGSDSDRCPCDPDAAARFTAMTGLPAGRARADYARNRTQGRDRIESLARVLVGIPDGM